MIRRLSLSDPIDQVASLIYHTDATLFPLLFGPYEKAKPVIMALIKKENNAFSHRFIDVFIEDATGDILGLIITYTNDEKPNDKDFQTVIKGPYALRVGFMSLLFYRLLNPKLNQSLYIQNLSVKEAARGQGVGTQLLHHVYAHAKETSIPTISLDVSLDNKKAMRLYLKEGFQLIKKRRLLGLIPMVYWCEKPVD